MQTLFTINCTSIEEMFRKDAYAIRDAIVSSCMSVTHYKAQHPNCKKDIIRRKTVGEWNILLTNFEKISRSERAFYGNIRYKSRQVLYQIYNDKEHLIHLFAFNLSHLSPEPEWKFSSRPLPLVFSVHFLNRYKQRYLDDMSLSIDEVAHKLIYNEISIKPNIETIDIPHQYGQSLTRRNAVIRLNNGVGLGYIDTELRIYYFDTFVRYDMLFENQQQFIPKGEFGGVKENTTKLVAVKNGAYQELSQEEINELIALKDTEEFEQLRKDRIFKDFRDNQRRMKRKYACSSQPKEPYCMKPKVRPRRYEMK